MLYDPSENPYRTFGELSADCRIVEESGLFDEQAYRSAAGIEGAGNIVAHYLREGWQAGLEPSPEFEGSFQYPYFRSAGLCAAPALSYVLLRSAGWPVFARFGEAESLAALIRSSAYFDVDAYRAQAGGLEGLDPALHYVLVGEQLGYVPSAEFDPGYYRERYPDVAEAGANRLAHYLLSGREEGRRPKSVASAFTFDRTRLDPDRQTVLLVSHQASRTGAPILAYNIAQRLLLRYNVVTLLLSGGQIASEFEACSSAVVGPPQPALKEWHPADAKYLVQELLAAYPIAYVIANSIESRIVLEPLAHALVPVTTLVHEFPNHLPRKEDMGRSLEWSTQIVFSANLVAAAAKESYLPLQGRTLHVLPQGRSALPPVEAGLRTQEQDMLRKAMRPDGAENALVVLGCGTIYARKGVDLFISCAAAVAAARLSRPVRFVWIGQRLAPEDDRGYFDSISTQIARLRLQDKVVILDEVGDLEFAYSLADMLFLSSRLDPLPNVSIDAALRGMPVVCFEGASGIAELLKDDVVAKGSVVPNLDIRAAAKLIARLSADEVARSELGRATQRLAERTFDMDRYVQRLDDVSREAMDIMHQRAEDCATIEADSMFDPVSFLGRYAEETTRQDAIRQFVARSAVSSATKIPAPDFYYRRPCAGFHPHVYAHENASVYDVTTVNPLAHFIRSGKPNGPWRHESITPSPPRPVPMHRPPLRTAIHAHFFYPELLDDFLLKLQANRSTCDLLLSTNTRAKADRLRAGTSSYRQGNVEISVVPNRGRDIGPFLTTFGKAIGGYDIIGHVHSKRTLSHSDAALGEMWREFGWQHLVGDLFPMMDIVLDRFQADEKLGLVFPEDPHLPDWTFNRAIAEQLAERLGIEDPLPPFFDFPVGTMFWARTGAIAPLFDLGLDWADYPKEPAPIDGSILHALERLFPFVARRSGYRYATTHVPNVTW